MKRLALLGSTGSVGEQTLAVAAAFPERFQVVALAAGRRIDKLADQVKAFEPAIVAVAESVRAGVERTRENREMVLAFALSYGGRAEIVDAARRLCREVELGKIDPESVDEKVFAAHLYDPDLPDPDLLIRTGAESRVSNFLLWQIAYTEIYTTDVMWPDFRKSHLVDALVDYQDRERRFGRTGEQVRSREDGDA